MKTATNVIRVVFLVLAMVTYARPSFAGSPAWWADCNSGCNGLVRYHQCTFMDYNDWWDTYSGTEACADAWLTDESHISCCISGASEWGDPYHEAYARFYGDCYGWAGGGSITFTGWSCSENATRGSFYCSYIDESCAG